MRRAATIIAGGGPAGLSAAVTLARGGGQPILIERHARTPDQLCGGFLSWRTLESLEKLGIDPNRLGGHAITRVAFFIGTKSRTAALPHFGMGLSRRRLDSMLLEAAQDAGADVRRGIALSNAEPNGRVRLADGQVMTADALFLATGKYELRGVKRPVERAVADPWIGLRYRIMASRRLNRTIDGTIEMHLFRHGYAGFLLQEEGAANLCLAVRRSRLSQAGGHPLQLLTDIAAESPALADRLSGEALPDEADAVSRVPYGWRMRTGQAGLFRIGDQAAVIPSLAGEGIGIALASGRAAAGAYLRDGADGAIRYQRVFANAVRRPIAIAAGLKALANRPRLARYAIGLMAIPSLVRLLGEATRIRA